MPATIETKTDNRSVVVEKFVTLVFLIKSLYNCRCPADTQEQLVESGEGGCV